MVKEIPCNVCGGNGYVSFSHQTETSAGICAKTCPHCNGSGVREVPMTNADHIRSMSDEELAATGQFPCPYMKKYEGCKFGWSLPEQACEECVLEWLKAPYKENTDE